MVPIEYAEGVQLLKQPQIPCTVDNKNNNMCNLYKYIDLNRDGFVMREAEGPRRTRRNVIRLFNDTAVTSKLEFNAMVQVSPENVSFFYLLGFLFNRNFYSLVRPWLNQVSCQ